MAISIDENILLGSAVAIFIPVFVFMIKLIIEIGNIKGKIETMCHNIEEHKKSVSDMNTVKTDLKLINLRLDNIEREVSNHNNTRRRSGSPMDNNDNRRGDNRE